MKPVRQAYPILTKIAALGCVSLMGAACVSNPDAALNPDGTPSKQATRAVSLDDMPADTVRSADVVNRSKEKVTRTGEIYLMRGLANVFSRGIDQMAKQLRNRGYDAANFSYTEWRGVAADIVTRANAKEVSYPIVIIGHSLGGNESSKFANFLAERDVPVSLVVTFDPVETGFVGPKIGDVINYYLPKSANNKILPKDGFSGEITNVDVTVIPSMTHTNVDKYPEYQNATYASIQNITKKQVKRVKAQPEPGR